VGEPDVSVVVRVRNCEDFIGDAVESVLAQTMERWELIVVDDGSTDHTVEVVESFSDQRVLIVRQPASGYASAGNTGITAARARYIALLDADDTALPERLARQLEYLERRPECVLVGGSMHVVTESREFVYTHHAPTSEVLILRTLAQGESPFMNPSVMFRRDAAVEVGLYSEALNGCSGEDTEFFRRLVACGDLANLPDVLGEYRITRGALTTTIAAMPKRAVLRRSRAIDHVVSGSASSEDIHFLRDFLRLASAIPPEYAYHLRVGKAYRDYGGNTAAARRHLLSALRYKPTSMKAGYNLIRSCGPFQSRGPK
jgi:glycosyltransferase involved in cell wall biosynthesis